MTEKNKHWVLLGVLLVLVYLLTSLVHNQYIYFVQLTFKNKLRLN